MLLIFIAALIVATTCQAIKADPDEDAYIYQSIIASIQELQERQTAEKHNPQYTQEPHQATSVCYEELGCFDKKGTFKHLKQLPEPPETVNTFFLLYTRKNRDDPQILDYKKPETILQSNIDPKLPLKIITHGFGGSNNMTWIWDMKTALLEKHDLNVIIMDWSQGARAPYYIQASVNSELVGAQGAVLFYFFKDKLGMMEKDLHLIGYSLGAHMVGFIGKRMQLLRGTKPGRITGLDPASPLFEDYGEKVRLDKSDGEFVDVVHTNADLLLYGGIGIGIPLGHVDFFPNGGKRQPGCGSTLKGALIDIFSGDQEKMCNHERAVHLFTDSVLSDDICHKGFQCSNYTDFEGGKCMSCEGACGTMGYHAKGSGSYYLMTNAKKPFCADVAKLTVKFPKTIKKSYGSLILTMTGGNGGTENVTLTVKDKKLVPGDEKMFAIPVTDVLKPLRAIQAIYIKYNGWFTKGADTFGVSSVSITDTEGNHIFNSCGTDIILKHNEYVILPETAGVC